MIWTAAIAVPTLAMHLSKDRLNLMLMGLFRDIGRHKAHRRRYGDNSMALMTVLLHKEEDIFLGGAFEDSTSDVPTYTLQELWEYGNGEGDSPLLISVFGRIYDVSEGEKYYGPEGRYPSFAGHDVTYALSTGCRTCVAESADKLTEKQMLEGKRWLSFFQLHDKYPYVGKLENYPLEDKMNQWIDEAIAKHSEDDIITPPIMGGAQN
jgi:predicted heme/steroid binding protein